MEDFIELNRTFNKLTGDKTGEAENDNVDISEGLSTLFSGSVGWEDLLKEPRLILLAEAGAGKTQEIRNTTKKLRLEGKPAFFLRLEHIADGIETALEDGTYQEFEKWLNSNQKGWILLDSVDEARLKDPKDFERAIIKLANLISPAIQRTHIIITSRVTAWRPKSDLDLCKNRFPYIINSEKIILSSPDEVDTVDHEDVVSANFLKNGSVDHSESNENKKEKVFKIYTINDLSKEQIRLFVSAKGIRNDSTLLEEIDRQDAWAFTTRPQDLEEVIEYWKEKKSIGTRLELMKYSIDSRIREREENRKTYSPLTAPKARDGVRVLAAACSLMHESTIRVPDGSNLSPGVDVESILIDDRHNWARAECQALLSLPIFDEAIYGCVRFHHRSVREYLTAEWLAEKLKGQGSRKKIEGLFFRKQYGMDVVIPSMKPILSWLVLLDQSILDKVYKLEPEIILNGGDPSKLPLDFRKNILRSVCENIATGIANSSIDEQASLERFSSRDLAGEIKCLIEKYKANQDVVSYLLRMVLKGHMSEVIPEVKPFALNSEPNNYCRSSAIRVVEAIGSAGDFQDLADTYLSDPKPYDRISLSALISGLKSTKENIGWIVSALEDIQPKEKYGYDGLHYSLINFVQRSDEALLLNLIKGFDKFLRCEPVIERLDIDVSQKFSWLMPISLKAVEKLVLTKNSNALCPESMYVLSRIIAFEKYGDSRSELINHDLIKLVPEWKELNYRLFWYDVERTRYRLAKEENGPLKDFWHVSIYGHYWKFDENDFDYLIAEILNRVLLDDKHIALSLAFKLYRENSRPKKWLSALKKAVGKENELRDTLDSMLQPPKQSEKLKKALRQNARWKKGNEQRNKKNTENHIKSIKWLNENYESLRNPGLEKGKVSNGQAYIFNRIREKNGAVTSRLATGNWDDVIEEYGLNVAEAYRDGLLNFWRTYTPALRSEHDHGSSIPYALVFGLSGVEAEINAGGLEKFSEADAELACRYAIHESNGFPSWFYQLCVRFPDTIYDIILAEIEWEISSKESIIHVLSSVSWSYEWLWDRLGPKLLPLLEKALPNGENLLYALKIIQGSFTVSNSDLANLAARKCKSAISLENLGYWFSTWIGVDPDPAIHRLTSHLKKLLLEDKEAAKNLAMKVVVCLAGEKRYQLRTRENFKTPYYLKQLFLLIHTYVRTEEDIDRSNTGVYSPGLRDYAQEARSTLFSMLKGMSGKDTFLALIEFSETHPLVSHRSWMKRYAKERAELDAETSPWTAEKVIEFNRTLESTPSNHRELFELCVQRFEDLKHQLEEGDDSIASTLRKERKETGIRTVIANWSRDRAVGKYIVVQEEELADAKRPDLRFYGTLGSSNEPVPVELKLADNNWGGVKLFERLENQLCGDYLRDGRSNFGIFILVYRGEQKGWNIPNGKSRATFSELVEALQGHWETISYKFPKVEQISVIGIDLTKRENRVNHLSGSGKQFNY
ncbi:NACHT domain-containing protein [Arundinibacter roseus]|uniref:Uncharacterized protein n=1 Tax=Arundinibacter roseus TaxID=2070510 RepID=A0A4R4KI79_9BACT|nr:hypothetical protein [Arundinibacter roseus]TDB67850.1 hypothetical protein EZE20_02695 [Arundinibacter roseus]